jgi:PAS domain S-box-containing protein
MTINNDFQSMAAPEDYEGLLKDIMRSSQVMIWISTPQMQIVSGSQSGLDFYGITAEELLASNWQDYVHPEDRAQVGKNLEIWLRDRAVVRQEMRVKNQQGKYSWILDVSSPRYAPSGEFCGYLGASVDITEQKMQQFRLKEEMVQISEWEQNRIGRDLHDDLAQVMLGVSLRSMVLENKLKGKDLPEFLIAREMTAETNRVFSGLRKLSQALFPAKLSRLEFRGALRNLEEKLFQRHGLQVVMSVDPEAVPSDPGRALHLLRITQEALANVVGQGEKNRIKVDFKMGGNGISVLEVRYDGSGIAEDPYASGGLGFRLMKHRAELLGADVEIGRNFKGGVVFRCQYLPEAE